MNIQQYTVAPTLPWLKGMEVNGLGLKSQGDCESFGVAICSVFT